MRDLLAAVSDPADSPATFMLATVLVVCVSVGILAPTAVLCGACFGKKGSTLHQEPHASWVSPPQHEDAVEHPAWAAQSQVQSPEQDAWPRQQWNSADHYQPNGGAVQQSMPPNVLPLGAQQTGPSPYVHADEDPSINSANGRSGRGLEVREPSLRAVEELLISICSNMGGSIRPGKTLIRSSIRVGINAVIADIASPCAAGETAMFFAVGKFKQRHMSMYQHQSLRDSMPLVTMDVGDYVHREGGQAANLPACIFVDRAKSLSTVINSMQSPLAKQMELFLIWQYLAKQLSIFHSRGRYLRDVTFDNVVQVSMGNSRGWSLLEFARVAKDKRDIEKSTIPRRTVPPELAKEMLSGLGDTVRLSPAYDMWQLGVLVYEVLAEQPYWPSHMSDTAILGELADPRYELPHVQRPVRLNFVHRILMELMHRDPEHRFSSSELIARLELDLATAGAVTLNQIEGEVKAQAPKVLES